MAELARVDDTSQILESSEANNNSGTVTFTVVPSPAAPIRISAGGPA